MDDITTLRVEVAELRVELTEARGQCDRDRARADSERERLFTALEGVTKSLLDLRQDLARYKGWAGGMLFVVSALWAAFGMFKEKLWP